MYQAHFTRHAIADVISDNGPLYSQVRSSHDFIELKRQKGKSQFDKSARPLSELVYGEPVRLQPQNSKMPLSKGSCIGKVGPRSYLVLTDSGSIYRRNRRFIRQDKMNMYISIQSWMCQTYPLSLRIRNWNNPQWSLLNRLQLIPK